jgi:hypothetical protein
MDLVVINGITQILLVYTCKQGVYPRGHLLPIQLPLWTLVMLNLLSIPRFHTVTIFVAHVDGVRLCF